MMTLTQIQAFYFAATEGSFTAAAKQLAMTQPTVSELVRRIEDEYGIALFVRSGRKLVLTAAGRTLLPWAKRMLDGEIGGDAALRALTTGERGTVSFGILRNAGYYGLSDLATDFSRAHPHVKLRLVGQNSFEVADAVRAGELEAGLLCLPVPVHDLETTLIMQQEIVWASASAERCATPMRVEDIPKAPLILYDAHHGWNDPSRRQLAQRAQLRGVTMEPQIEVESVESAVQLVAAGLGDTLLPSAVVNSPRFPTDIHTTPFDHPLFDTFALVTRQGWDMSPITQQLARIAIERLLSTASRNDQILWNGPRGGNASDNEQ
ncbi:MAG: LysR family transcriptional regulator [Bifidobacteriaceae bacterium]|nr:LysR family transcriptional regulator [Bifidobacteriaceae bacterium]